MTYRSLRSAAGELRMSQPAVKRAILEGRIPAVEIRGVWRIPASYFEEREARAYSRVVREDVLLSRQLSSEPRVRQRMYEEFDDGLSPEDLLEEEVFTYGLGEAEASLDELRWSA